MSNSINNSSQKNILILMTGSIACYKVCSLISKLVQNHYSVKVVMSDAAQKFIGISTIEGLSQNKVHLNTFEPGHAMDHIYLDRWADLILMAPASANSINKISQGLGDDLISTLFLAHDFKKPFLVAPAMNTQMYLHPVTQKSIIELKSMNIEILETASGVLACGEVGYGKLLEPELIFSEIEKRISSPNTLIQFENKKLETKSQKILITSGGTQEAIDNVRVITNISTGRTAAHMADIFSMSGFDVTYLSARNAAQPLGSVNHFEFVSYKDLKEQLEFLLPQNFDLIIHAAAVSDYSVKNSHHGKIDSSLNELLINLIKNPKLIDQIKKISPNSKLVGFKLTSNLTEDQIKNKINSLLTHSHCDFVVHNDWSTVHTSKHVFNLYDHQHNIENLNLTDLTYKLIDLIFLKKESR